MSALARNIFHNLPKYHVVHSNPSVTIFRSLLFYPHLMVSPSPHLLDSPSPSPQIVPGAWPDKSLTRPPTPESPQHLDQVLSFHKRLSLSFSSPIMMPTRSPLLGMSASGSSIGAVAVGSQVNDASIWFPFASAADVRGQHEPLMTLAALAVCSSVIYPSTY